MDMPAAAELLELDVVHNGDVSGNRVSKALETSLNDSFVSHLIDI